MNESLTVTLKGAVCEEIQKLAARDEKDIDQVVEMLLNDLLLIEYAPNDMEDVVNLTEPDESVTHEIAAYHGLASAVIISK